MIPKNQTLRHKYKNQLMATLPTKEIKVLMIGNNPREMGCLNIHLRNFQWKRFAVNATFSLEEGWRIAQYFKPDYILIEAAFGEEPIEDLIRHLRARKSTRSACVALLKEDNLKQLMISGVQDYLLKDSISSDTFAFDVINAVAMKMHEDRNHGYAKSKSVSSWLPAVNIGKKTVLNG